MAAESDVLSEIEVLQSIYLDELQVSRTDDGGWEVSLVLYPSTAEDSLSQFVRLTLTLTLDLQYPSSPPSISIHNPRGLSDDKLRSVQRCLQAEVESCLGSPVLYQLIEKAKEILTESNIPHGNCVICLYGFKEDEAFTKTSCYHYFHSHCLGRYVTHSERELQERERELEEDKTRERADEEELSVVCPVCREPLTYDVDLLLSSPAPCGPKLEGEVLGADFRHKWRKLQKLLERQRARGGIIDPEVESNRFLIHINEAPADGEHDNLDADASPSQSVPAAPPVPSDEFSAPRDQQYIGQPHYRGGPGHRRQSQPRGPRRGGRGRPHHGRAAPPTEHMDRLSLASDGPYGCSTEAPIKARLQVNQGQHKLGAVEPKQPEKADGDGSTDLNRQEAPLSADQRETCQPGPDALKTHCPKDSGECARGRGRRRGPRGSGHQPGHWQDRQWDAQWDGRGSRSRGRARGGGSRRGHGRGLHQKAMEREVGREGVL